MASNCETSSSPSKWLVPVNVDLKIHQSDPRTQDPQPLHHRPLVRERRIERKTLDAYLSHNSFGETTCELTIGALQHLQSLAKSASAKTIRRLTLICDPTSFPHKFETVANSMLRAALISLVSLKTIIVKMKPRTQKGETQQRAACIKCVAYALAHLPDQQHAFRCLREIRLEIDEKGDWEHVVRACRGQSRPGRRPMWNVWFNSLQRLHVVVMSRASAKSRVNANANANANGNDGKAAFSAALASLDHAHAANKTNNEFLATACMPRYPPATVRIDKMTTGPAETHATIFVAHQSGDAEKTERLLKSVKGQHHVRLSEEQPEFSEEDNYRRGRAALDSVCGLQKLHLRMPNADAKTLCDIIGRNQRTLRSIALEVSLTSGTWEQVFLALVECNNLNNVSAFRSGLTYTNAEGFVIQTGYLVPGKELPERVVRYGDRHALSSLIRTIGMEPLGGPSSGAKLDISWSSLINGYAPPGDYWWNARYADERKYYAEKGPCCQK